MLLSPHRSLPAPSFIRRFALCITLAGLTFLYHSPAHAACTTPPGETGQIIYNTTHHVFQGCRADGQWLSLGGASGSGSTPPPSLSSVLATGNDAENNKITGLAAPTTGTDLARKSYVDGKFGTLTNNLWCRASGTQIVCDQTAPSAPSTPNLASVLAVGNGAGNQKITSVGSPTVGTDGAPKSYVDSKFGTLTNTRWCMFNGTQIVCDQTAPSAPATPNLASVLAVGNGAGNTKITGLATPTVGTDAAHKNYVDGKFGTLTNTRWCTSNGTQVICNQTPPVLSESDPKIAATTNNKWCRGTGATIACNQDLPAPDGDILAGLSCATGQTAVKTAGGWGCADLPPVYENCTLNGQLVYHGGSYPFYSATQHADCAGNRQWRTCNDGVLSGSTAHDKTSCTQVRNRYFVLSSATFMGNHGGLSGANARCLNDLTSNDWKGKDTALLNAETVSAFLCTGSTCQDLQRSSQYIYAQSGSTSAGGATFTSNASGLGPNSSTAWSGTTYFGVTATYWTNRDNGSNTLWSSGSKHQSSDNNCNNWTSTSNRAEIGASNLTGTGRWSNGYSNCNVARRLICIVDVP